MKIKLLAAALLVFSLSAQGADKVKIGFISTLSEIGRASCRERV